MRGKQKRKETVNKKQLDQAKETDPSNESYFLLSVTIMFSIPNQPFTGSPDCNSSFVLLTQVSPGEKRKC